MNDWLFYGLIFFLAVAATFLIVRAITGPGKKVNNRLEYSDEPDELALGDLTKPIGQWTLAGGDEKAKAALEQELREAGYYRPTALVEYAAVRTLLVAAPIVVALALALNADQDLAPWILGAGAFLALLGYSLPRAYINYRAQQRSREVERGLPVAVDLLSLCLTGGQNFIMALERVARDLEFSFPVLAQELRIVHRHAQMAGLDMALRNFAKRTGVPEVKNLAMMLAHVDRLGTDVAVALLEFSSNFRQTIRLRAEAYANRVSFWVLFPTILCLVVPGVLLFYAPLLYEASRIREQYREDMQKSQQNQRNMQKLQRSTTDQTP